MSAVLVASSLATASDVAFAEGMEWLQHDLKDGLNYFQQQEVAAHRTESRAMYSLGPYTRTATRRCEHATCAVADHFFTTDTGMARLAAFEQGFECPEGFFSNCTDIERVAWLELALSRAARGVL